ncbi:unnamed protein product [Periconia digitata]|uniref:Uncharacterized protein n=1 Tax=Periconia digitata TaxID=1303443 RepID=A0A9W4XU54_9PLEO|nr:unnamed protein product [Periconia digitata]
MDIHNLSNPRRGNQLPTFKSHSLHVPRCKRNVYPTNPFPIHPNTSTPLL